MSDLSHMLLIPLLLFAGSPAPAQAAAQNERPSEAEEKAAVTAVVEGATEQLLSLLKSRTVTEAARQRGVQGVLGSLVDYDLISKLSLGKAQWRRFSDEQRTQFTSLFTEMLQFSTYEKLVQFKGESARSMAPERIPKARPPKYRVVLEVQSKEESTDLVLLMARRKEGWRVYDLELQGVSILKTYASQFSDFLAKKTPDNLLDELATKVADYRKKFALGTKPPGNAK